MHLFRNFALQMKENGHQILLTYREREHVSHLISSYGLMGVNFGQHYKSTAGKIFGLFRYDLRMLREAVSFKPDVFLSHGSMYAAQAAKLMGKPHISFEDTFNMEQVKLYLPFTKVVLTGNYPHPILGEKEIRYPGYHELAYLHPSVYTPDPRVYKELGITPSEKYAILRFIGWNATHDVGHQGLTHVNKLHIVHELNKLLKVYISSELELPYEFDKYRINIKPEHIHDALCYAHLFVGEGATTAAEAAILGTPAILIHNTSLGYIADQASYGLVTQFSEAEADQKKAIEMAIETAKDDEVKTRLTISRKNMLNDKIDVTAFLSWLVENYPTSVDLARKIDFDFNMFRSDDWGIESVSM